MKRIAIIIVAFAVTTSCNRVKNGAKEAIVKTGETVGKASTEFSNGVGEGVKQALECEVVLSEDLKKKGLHAGKIDFTSQKEANDNGLAAYLIFDNDFKDTIKVKVFNEKGLEYGRTATVVKGKKGEAGYYDFVFDKRVNLEGKSKFVME